MPSLIQLKRSLNTSVPASLANGEPAFTSNGDVFYIGANSEVVAIGGRRFPGTVTANQAVVTNGNNFINELKFGNTSVNAIVNSTAFSLVNSTVTFTILKPTAAQISDGNYVLKASGAWEIDGGGGTATPGGAATQIQFNNAGAFGGTAGLTFDSSTNNVVIANTLSVANVQAGNVNLAGTRVHVGNTTANVTANSILVRVANSSAASNLTPSALTIGSSSLTGTRLIAGVVDANVTVLAVSGDLTVTGNLTISGTTTTIDTQNLTVSDPLIRLADDQSNTGTYADTLDIGVYGTYGNTSQSGSAGIFRDASDSGVWKLFSGLIPTPGTTVDTANVNFSIGTLQAFLRSGGLLSNSSVVNITANSTVSVALIANTLTLSSALTGPMGGTGLATYTAEDILVANSTHGFRKLGVGTDGQVLQSVSGVLTYGSLDGGVF